MKILTLNTHSIVEENYEKKLKIFIDAIKKHRPDIISMQEVNQSANSKLAGYDDHFVPCESFVPLKCDNHVYVVSQMLKECGIRYYYTWTGIKLSWQSYDEGLAVMSLNPISEINVFPVSSINSYYNWKTRKALVVKTGDIYICNTHMGWWNDEQEPYINQWKKLSNTLSRYNDVYLTGDFNSPSNIKGEGYDAVIADGWYDTYIHALFKDDGYTVTKQIDGWQGDSRKRIDYIFTSFEPTVKSSYVIFNGENEDTVSDHNGIIITI